MKYIFANWKMYIDYEESVELINKLKQETFDIEKVEIGIFPNTIAFSDIVKITSGTDYVVGAQNVAWVPAGAYTGAVSAYMFKQVGAKYALVGHSERRYIFGETNEDVRKKVKACLDVGLIPVLCIGETKEDLELGKREYRLKKQIMKVFEGLNLSDEQNIIIAYEPVWAVSRGGIGQSCGPIDADDVHSWIKNELREYTDRNIPIIYGGSVNSDTVETYISRGTIDGVLVGNASTKYESFVSLIKTAEAL